LYQITRQPVSSFPTEISDSGNSSVSPVIARGRLIEFTDFRDMPSLNLNPGRGFPKPLTGQCRQRVKPGRSSLPTRFGGRANFICVLHPASTRRKQTGTARSPMEEGRARNYWTGQITK
jgi:hypothetical protein